MVTSGSQCRKPGRGLELRIVLLLEGWCGDCCLDLKRDLISIYIHEPSSLNKDLAILVAILERKNSIDMTMFGPRFLEQ